MDMMYVLIGVMIFAVSCVIIGGLIWCMLMLYLSMMDELKSRGMIKPKKKKE